MGGGGDTLAALIDDLEANHPGIKDRLIEARDGRVDLRRFVNVYVNDEDVRFTGGLGTELSDESLVPGPEGELGSISYEVWAKDHA